MISNAIIRYFVMPELMPRIKELFFTGFGFISFFIAQVYSAVGLLPAHHPYLNSAHIGKYGIRHVIAEASQNLVLSTRNLDQIILFFAVILGVVLCAFQIAMLGMMLFVSPVLAAASFADLFTITATQAEQDLAYIMLDMVFGAQGIFNSCVATAANCTNAENVAIEASQATLTWAMEADNFPSPVHVGMHRVFALYSFGLLVVATMIFSYMIVTVLAETMQSGTAFGKRYNHVWAPIRMVVAFGLLMPLNTSASGVGNYYGFNSAQYIVLYAAKYGSNFATKAWLLFNNELGAATAIQAEKIATPNPPELEQVVQFIYLAKACGFAETSYRDSNTANDIKMYVVKDNTAATAQIELGNVGSAPTYTDLINFANGASVLKVRFGYKDEKKFAGYAGYVAPVCGELNIPLTDTRAPGSQNEGNEVLQRFYISLVRDLWHDNSTHEELFKHYPYKLINKNSSATAIGEPTTDMAKDRIKYAMDNIKIAINGGSLPTGYLGGFSMPAGGAIGAMRASARFNVPADLNAKGWAGAAIWYNRIAEMNGAASSAILNIPVPTLYPAVMEEVYRYKQKTAGTVGSEGRYDPELSSGGSVKLKDQADEDYARAYSRTYNFWSTSGVKGTPHTRSTGNMLYDILNQMIGTDGLFNIRNNMDVHPLAQLSAVGQSLIEASLRNLSATAVYAGGGAVNSILKLADTSQIDKIAGAVVTLTMVTMTAGFILYYIIPFLPFIYFSFAFGGWVKGIFEAMVGVPLWALAHIRIDGNGLSGQAALSGYFLVFEIFLRPILMIAGFLASISIFSALVYVLNIVFDMVVANVGGFDVDAAINTGLLNVAEMRDVVDEFFYTILYVMIVYLMGMSSFKMVDLVPNNILRWMGQSVTTFNDSQENAAESLTGRATTGAQQLGQSVGGGLSKIVSKGS